MKFNKWTLGLATVGAVSLASAARADEKMNALNTALSNTTISGYVSASFNWAIDPGGDAQSGSPAQLIPFQGPTKQDGFNLDVVKLSSAKPEDESPWASGYQVDLYFGPDAVGYNPSANGTSGQDFAIKQAYISLRTPIGNGIDWKIGVFDTVIGYEVTDAGSNPNYTRSYGYAVEPTEHTGVLGTYKINDSWTVSAGIANTLIAGINQRARDKAGASFNHSYTHIPYAYGYNYSYNYNNYASVNDDWKKTLMGSITFTAPTTWGWAAGSSAYAGVVAGFGGSGGGGNSGYYSNGQQINYYLGVTMNTPWKQLTTGLAFDYVHNLGGGSANNNYSYSYTYNETTGVGSQVNTHTTSRMWNDVLVVGLYATYKATDKLSFNGRAEYLYAKHHSESDIGQSVTPSLDGEPGTTVITHTSSSTSSDISGEELTATVEYDLWANVTSRVEARWDHSGKRGSGEGVDLDQTDSYGLYANVIYKF
jgi:hypothetical protein